MSFDLEALLIVLAFVLPGFLTSRLIQARTPAMGRQASPFEETSESLLRSVYINLCIAVGVLLLLQFDRETARQLAEGGIQQFASTRPIQASTYVVSWLVFAFLLATAFGYWWDPLDAIYRKLGVGVGAEPFDLWYSLRQTVVEQREQGRPIEMWIQAKLKNGAIYQGEFWFVGLRHGGQDRELLLRNVKVYPYASRAASEPEKARDYFEKLDAVFLDIADCDSVEVIFSDSLVEETNQSV